MKGLIYAILASSALIYSVTAAAQENALGAPITTESHGNHQLIADDQSDNGSQQANDDNSSDQPATDSDDDSSDQPATDSDDSDSGGD